MFTKEQIARAALEAGVGVEKIKQMLKLLDPKIDYFTRHWPKEVEDAWQGKPANNIFKDQGY